MLRRAAVLLALLLPLSVFTAAPAHAGTESEFVSRANGARASRGLRAYAVRSDLTAVARRQAARMAASGRMYHNPNLGSEVSGWRNVGENVGRGPDVRSIHNAFMGSSAHRANILSTTYTEIGVGTARSSSGELFVSQVFRRPTRATTSYAAPRPTTTAPRPVVRTSPTRASRSAPRAPLTVRGPVAAPPRKPAVVVDRTPAKLRAAWVAHRRSRPVASLDLAVAFVRANRLVAD